MKHRQRLDLILVERGLVDSREKGQALILAGEVMVDGQKVDKPGHAVAADSKIELADQMNQYQHYRDNPDSLAWDLARYAHVSPASAHSWASRVLDPQARRVDLRAAQGNQSVQGVVLPNGNGYLVKVDLRPLSSGQTYQLWAITGSRQVSLGVLGADPQQAAFSLGSQNAASTLAVTVEPFGGVTSTTNPTVVSGTVS